MPYKPLHEPSYRPSFSGHETFPLRYGWLKKAFDRVTETEHNPHNKSMCWGDDAIAQFGVGKNMVASIRHWATSCDIIEEADKEDTVIRTILGKKLFGNNGIKGHDPYMEHPATLWLIHWQLAAIPEKTTTWFWAFSYYPDVIFTRNQFVQKIQRFAKERNWKPVSNTTLKNDVACFIRTYVARKPKGKTGHDDALESPLTELGIIKPLDEIDGFRFVRGPKSSLGNGIFIYALLDFWSRYSITTNTLSFEAIAHEPGGPGRVFALEENDVVDYLTILDEETRGQLQWSEAAGLKQVIRNIEINEETKFKFILPDYDRLLIHGISW
jgi:hypothetical protein